MVWNQFLQSDSGYTMKDGSRREEMSENTRTKHCHREEKKEIDGVKRMY